MHILYFIVILPFFNLCSAFHRISLNRIESGRRRMIRDGTWISYLADRQQSAYELQRLAGQHGSTPMKDYSDANYVATVQLGTPGQTFHVVPDSGSPVFWIPADTCGQNRTCPAYCSEVNDNCSAQGCPRDCCGRCQHQAYVWVPSCVGKDLFHPSESTTYETDDEAFCIHYGVGTAKGFQGTDTLTFADIVIRNTTFGLATGIGRTFEKPTFDGIMGISWPMPAISNMTTVVTTMLNEGLLDEPFISIYLGSSTKPGDIGGEITVGGVDVNRYSGDIAWLPLSAPGLWQFKFESVRVNSTVVKPSAGAYYTALSDTGTSLITGPSDDVDALAAALNGTYEMSGMYSVNCSLNGLPSLVFVIQGVEYVFEQEDYIMKFVDSDNETTCYLGIEGAAAGQGADWIFGDMFIKTYYTVYDYVGGRIGLARANHSNYTESTTASPTSAIVSNVSSTASPTSAIVSNESTTASPTLTNGAVCQRMIGSWSILVFLSCWFMSLAWCTVA